jgi:DNA-directed RNA polymerase specialized sigma24 family protein
MTSSASDDPEPAWARQLVPGNEEAWEAFWHDCASDLLGYCRKHLNGVDKAVLEEVRDEAVAIVFENVTRGKVLAEPRRFAFGVVRNLCMKRAGRSQDVTPSFVTPSFLDGVPGSSCRPSVLVGTAEEVGQARLALQQLFETALQDVLCEARRDVRRGIPSAPLLQWAVIDYVVSGRAQAPKLPELLDVEKSQVSKLRSAALARLGAVGSRVGLAHADLESLLVLDEVAGIWRRQLVGCPRFVPPTAGVHLVHERDLQLWGAVHAQAVDCSVCSSGGLVEDGEARSVAKSYGDAAARRSRI